MTYSGDRILLGSQRESQVSKFRPWVLFVVPAIAILFNFYIPLFFHFLGFLDLPLLVTVYFALMRRSPIAGTFIGVHRTGAGLASEEPARTVRHRQDAGRLLRRIGRDAVRRGPSFHPAAARLFFLLLPRIFFLGAGPSAARPAGGLRLDEHARSRCSQRGSRAIPVSFSGQAQGDDLE